MTQVNGAPVRVSDLGHMVLSHQEREGILGKDTNPDTVEGIVLMLKYQNPSETLKGIHAKVDELNRQLARQDVRIVPYIDRDDLVRATVHKVGRTIAEGIEIKDQLTGLQALGCELGQGYFFARPVNGEAMGRLLADGPVGTLKSR